MKKVCTEAEVKEFINRFVPKFDVFGVIYINREKNEEALASLGITRRMRDDIVRSISITNYVETIIDELSFGDMWVFGRDYSGEELYIKISLGQENRSTICISFHKAEHPINYAFKSHDKENN